ncbi:glycosyltransferase family 87 protein [Georgenia sp. AZ-5]|uniref:glycosyltransferase family 87 protein n=1 Tax=Georgenia sp. AZ-5 TaxID=3367526 RepID=UPI003754FF3A
MKGQGQGPGTAPTDVSSPGAAGRRTAASGRAESDRRAGPEPKVGTGGRRAAGVVLWPTAVLVLLHAGWVGAVGPAHDLHILWSGSRRLLSGGPLYDPDLAFIYPPLAGWALAPLGVLPFRGAVVVMTLVSLAALVAAVVLVLGLVGVAWRSPLTAGVLLAAALSRPVQGLLHQGNLDVLLTLAQVVMIRALVARRDVAAGALLGVVCAVKPTLTPLVLGALLLRRVRVTLVAVGVGAVLTVLGFLLVPDGRVFLTDVLPMLGDGNRPELHRYDRSLQAAVEELGLPGPVGGVLRVAAFAVAVGLGWRRRHGPLAPLEVMPLLLLGGLLASSFSWANYSLYLLPLLVTVVLPGSLVRAWPAWAGVYALWSAGEWPSPGLGGTFDSVLALRPLWGWLLLLLTCAWVAVRAGPAMLGLGWSAGRGPRQPPDEGVARERGEG